ncbi:unnamed protein product, partial [marine sediment metagenome]
RKFIERDVAEDIAENINSKTQEEIDRIENQANQARANPGNLDDYH